MQLPVDADVATIIEAARRRDAGGVPQQREATVTEIVNSLLEMSRDYTAGGRPMSRREGKTRDAGGVARREEPVEGGKFCTEPVDLRKYILGPPMGKLSELRPVSCPDWKEE